MTPVARSPHAIAGANSKPGHFAGIDALRAVAAVAVVLLHACVPYASPSMAGLSWSVLDTPDQSVTYLFWGIEVVIMPIFLVIAGFFAARSVAHRGAWSTAMARTRRLGWPLLLTVVFLLPVEFYTWMLGWVADGQVAISNVKRMKFEGGVDRNLWGLSHLWFLQYLIMYVVVLASVWRWIVRLTAPQIARYLVPACFGVAVVSLAMRPEVVWGFQHSFIPVLSKWLYSGAFFAAGALWYRLDPELDELKENGSRLLGPGMLLMAASVCMGTWWLATVGDPAKWINGGWAGIDPVVSSDRFAGGLPVTSVAVRGGLSALTVSAASLMTFGLIGVCLANVSGLGRTMKSLAAASFLIYLLHHPVVGLAHIAAKFALPGVSPMAKVSLATGLGVAAGWSVSWLAQQRRMRTSQRIESDDSVRSIEFPRTNESVARSRAA